MSHVKHEFFPSTRSLLKTKEGTVLVLPGLLGEKTMLNSVVTPLTQDGFNVMMVGHSRRNRRLHACNEDRSIDVHTAAKAAIAATKGDKTMHLLAHSMGGFDAVHAMEYARDKKEPPPYSYYGFGAIAAVGRNGFTPGPHNLIAEFWSHRNEVRENMNGEFDVLKKSSGSLVRNPVLALFEAISAARADVDEATLQLEHESIFQQGYEVYGSHDRVVPKPKTRVVHEYTGHHMTPVYTPGIAIDVARVITDSQSLAA